MNKTVIDPETGKVFEKSKIFGNIKSKKIHKSKKHYDRKKMDEVHRDIENIDAG
jgi:hypothetical protein